MLKILILSFTIGKKNRKKWKPVAVNSVLTNVVVRTTTSWAEEVENELSGI